MREFCTSGSVGTSGRKRPGVTRQGMFIGGLIAAGAVLAIGQLVSLYVSSKAKDAKGSAFVTYDKDLRAHLGLCKRAGRVQPCSSPTKPSPIPSTRATNEVRLWTFYGSGLALEAAF
jgi:hypothetical protein